MAYNWARSSRYIVIKTRFKRSRAGCSCNTAVFVTHARRSTWRRDEYCYTWRRFCHKSLFCFIPDGRNIVDGTVLCLMNKTFKRIILLYYALPLDEFFFSPHPLFIFCRNWYRFNQKWVPSGFCALRLFEIYLEYQIKHVTMYPPVVHYKLFWGGLLLCTQHYRPNLHRFCNKRWSLKGRLGQSTYEFLIQCGYPL